jgi:hypothetical protein
MISIYEWISRLQERNWNYYTGLNDKVFLARPFVESNTSQDFISRYFTIGGKMEAMRDFDIENFGIPRADHTISIFFLGILLYSRTKIKNRPFFVGRMSKHYGFFEFIWFLTCLSHDGAYHLEGDTNLFKSAPDLDNLKRHLALEYDLTTQTVANVPQDMFELIEAYYSFKHEHPHFKVVDHGIYGGMLLYDRLVKNRIRKKAMNEPSLLWEEFLDDHYAYAAATVAIHNMWFPVKSDYALYRRYGLAALIERPAIKFFENPLLYLLGLVDTIDPVKAYKDIADPATVLTNVYLTFSKGSSFKLSVSKELNFNILSGQANKLGWLEIGTDVIGRSICFSIPDCVRN